MSEHNIRYVIEGWDEFDGWVPVRNERTYSDILSDVSFLKGNPVNLSRLHVLVERDGVRDPTAYTLAEFMRFVVRYSEDGVSLIYDPAVNQAQPQHETDLKTADSL